MALNISQTATDTASYYRRRIGIRTQAFEWHAIYTYDLWLITMLIMAVYCQRVFIGFIKSIRQDEPSWSVYQVDGTPPTK